MDRIKYIYDYIVTYLHSKYKIDNIRKSRKSFSMYIQIADNKKIRISDHKNKRKNSDLVENIIYKIDMTINEILRYIDNFLLTLINN